MEPEFTRAAEECQVSASAVQNELWDAEGTELWWFSCTFRLQGSII